MLVLVNQNIYQVDACTEQEELIVQFTDELTCILKRFKRSLCRITHSKYKLPEQLVVFNSTHLVTQEIVIYQEYYIQTTFILNQTLISNK